MTPDGCFAPALAPGRACQAMFAEVMPLLSPAQEADEGKAQTRAVAALIQGRVEGDNWLKNGKAAKYCLLWEISSV